MARSPSLIFLPLQDRRRGAQVLDPAVRARADEDRVDLDVLKPRAGLEPHVFERPPRRVHLAALEVLGSRHDAGDRQDVLGRGAPGHDRRDILAPDRHDLVPLGVGVGEQRLPPRHRRFPLRALGRMGTALHIVEGLLVGRDQARAGAALDGHVADRHAAFHGQARIASPMYSIT
jgi:hypothetical protein